MNQSGLDFNVQIKTDDIIVNQNSDKDYRKPIEKESESKPESFIKKYNILNSAHPKTCFISIIFKLLSIISYFFLGSFSESNSFIFIIISLLIAFDFWIMKNVSGRLLVGLRWWNDFKEDGSEVWIFESYDGEMEINKIDSSIFWSSQYFSLIFWGGLLFINVLRFNLYWAMLNFLACTLLGINLMAFYKCDKEHGKKMSEMRDYVKNNGFRYIGEQIVKNALNNKK